MPAQKSHKLNTAKSSPAIWIQGGTPDLDHAILTNLKAELRDKLRFCFLAELNGGERQDSSSLKCRCEFLLSTIAPCDGNHVRLVALIDDLCSAPPKSGFNLEEWLFEVSRDPLKYHCLHVPKTCLHFSLSRRFQFSRLHIAYHPETRRLVFFGTPAGPDRRQWLTALLEQLVSKSEEVKAPREQRVSLCDYLGDEEYWHTQDNYQEILRGEKNHFRGTVAHLFLFDARDRRLYYNIVIGGFITDISIEAYCTELRTLKRRYPKLFISVVKLTEAQIKYTIANFRQRYFTPDSPKWDIIRDEVLDVLQRKLLSPSEIEAYLLRNPQRDRNRSLVAQILSCIPQEPWTGVAGYTAASRTPESSTQSEMRWNPMAIRASLFYRRLVLYEILLGVAGSRPMLAAPLLDCGQVSGTFFITTDRSNSNNKYNYSLVLRVAHSFSQYVSLRRERDFFSQALRRLSTEQLDDRTYDPLRIFAELLPTIFTPALVAVFKEGKQDPVDLFGYIYPDHIPDQDGLLPPTFRRLEQSMRTAEAFQYYSGWDVSQLNTPIHSRILDPAVVKALPPKGFEDHYNSRLLSFAIDGLTEMRIKSAIRINYQVEGVKGCIVVFFETDERHLRVAEQTLSARIDRLESFLAFELLRQRMMKARLVRTHHINQGVINPLIASLKRASGLLQTENTPTARAFLNRAQQLARYIQAYIGRIDSRLGASDGLQAKPAANCLMRMLSEIWADLRLIWPLQTSEEAALYNKHAQLIVNKKPLLPGAPPDAYFPVFISEDALHSIFFVLLHNIYDPTVLKYSLISKDASRTNTHVTIEDEEDRFLITVADHGGGMDANAVAGLNAMFEEIHQNSGDFDPRAFNSHLYSASPKARGLGVGLYIVASELSARLRKTEPVPISVRSEFGNGTTFSLVITKQPLIRNE